MLKKITVLAVAAGVVAAFVLPTSASATWKDHKTAIGTNVQLGLTGNARFQGTLGGVECQVTSKVKFLANQTTGNVESFIVDPPGAETETSNCKGLGGLAFCKIHNVTPYSTVQHLPSGQITEVPLSTQAPWTLHTGDYQTTQLQGSQTAATGPTHSNVIVVTTGDITSQTTGGFCPVNHINLTSGVVAALPNQPETITSVQLTGTLQGDLKTLDGTPDKEDVTVSGSLQIEEPIGGPTTRHTYSI